MAVAHTALAPQPARRIDLEEVLDGWQSHNAQILSRIGPGIHDDFLLDQARIDAEKGFCTPPLIRSQMLRLLGGRAYRLIPRCVITQASGKQRVIDDAAVGGQSDRSSDSNKLVLCTPLRPAQQAAAVLACLPASEKLALAQQDSLQTGSEDLPDAYRHCPMLEDEARACLVVWHHKDWGAPAFQLYSGLLFGLPLAVTSFNRYSRFLDAVFRRLGLVMASMYFDDCNMVDWASSEGSAQWAACQLAEMLGTPFAPEKRQAMAPVGTFLGLDHDLSEALSSGFVRFWARERLHSKMIDLIQQALAADALRPGLAAKIYGLMNFLEQGIYGRVGCAGLSSLNCRQHERVIDLTPDIRQSFDLILAVLSVKRAATCRRFLAASDAAEDLPQKGSGGFLLIWEEADRQVREGFVAVVAPRLYSLWTPGDKKIAQLELSMLLYALVARPNQFRHRRGVWWIDNTAALMALIRGRPDSPDLSRLAQIIHVGLFSLRTWM